MATRLEVLGYLRPNGGYVMRGESFEDIVFESDCVPFSKEEFEAAFEQVDLIKEQDKKNKAKAKKEILEKLGITEEEAKLLLS